MYYNKIRKTLHHWWQSYLLFKCSIVVLPIYSLLIIVGLYCLMYNIDPAPQIKTIYQLFLLILSAAVIFIFVLLLATLNGDNRAPSLDERDDESNDIDLEIDLETIATSIPRRRSFLRSIESNNRPTRSSISNFLTTIFGNYYDDENDDQCDDEYDDEFLKNSQDILEIASQRISPYIGGHTLPASLLMMNQTENQLVGNLERATDKLEYYLDRCNSSFESLTQFDEENLPPKEKFPHLHDTLKASATKYNPHNDYHFHEHNRTQWEYNVEPRENNLITTTSSHQNSLFLSLLPHQETSKTFGIGHFELVQPLPPQYDANDQQDSNQNNENQRNSFATQIVQTENACDEFPPPSYEEVTKKSMQIE